MFISAIPDAIETEQQNRIRSGRTYKRWLSGIRGVGLWLPDHEFGSNEFMAVAIVTGVERYVAKYRAQGD
ncbi:hypothetical protein ACSCX3_004169 [Enterobacter hormaechei]